MRKIIFAFVCSFIALGWAGCDVKSQAELPFFTKLNIIEIDSTASCCGIDSFTINSPWMQERINTFLMDSTRRKQEIATMLQFWSFTDSLGNDYFIENKHLLRNCEGELLEDLGENDSVAYAIYYVYNYPLREIVHIYLGVLPLCSR